MAPFHVDEIVRAHCADGETRIAEVRSAAYECPVFGVAGVCADCANGEKSLVRDVYMFGRVGVAGSSIFIIHESRLRKLPPPGDEAKERDFRVTGRTTVKA